MSLSQEQIDSLVEQKEQKIKPPESRFVIRPPQFPPEMIITEQQAQAIIEQDVEKQKGGYDVRTTTYFGYPILQEHSPRVMARKILSHNQFKQFTAISNIGKSGGGKSTSSQGLVHHLHEIGESEFGLTFHVRWVSKKELVEFDNFLKSCSHVNTIFIFEDISYALEMVKKLEKLKIKEAFTHIRHELKDVHVICIFHYHYTRAFDKMMRDSYYTIYTTLGHEEKGNILHIYGADDKTKEMLNKFQWRSRTQDEQGWFSIPLDSQNENRHYIYWTQNPFQIALTNQHDQWHFMLYASPKKIKGIACKHCVPKPENYNDDITPLYLIKSMQKVFGVRRANLILRWYIFMRGGKDCLSKYDRKAWVWLENFLQNHWLDFDKTIPLVKGEMRIGTYKQFREMNKKDSDSLTKDVLSKHKPFTEKRISDVMQNWF